MKRIIRTSIAIGIALCVALPFLRGLKADTKTVLPAIVESGLALYPSGGAEAAILAWRKGGPLEGDKEAIQLATELKQMEKVFGHYKSYELIDVTDVSKSSNLIYLSLNFERGAVFGKFLVFKTSKDWVIQQMEFDSKPEIVLRWLGGREK